MTALAYPLRPPANRWQQLVTPYWLNQLLAGKSAAPPSTGWQLFEIGNNAELAYASGHIPGASYLDTSRFERAPLWNKVTDADLLQCLLSKGITHSSCAIVYGRNNLAAARVAHLLLYAGVRDVRLLDGGLDAWTAAGLPLSCHSLAAQVPITSFGSVFPAHPEYLIDTLQAKRLLHTANAALVSIRSRAEFYGQTSGYSYIKACGEIPGARWGQAGLDGDINSMSAFQHADGRMKSAVEICRFWHEAGIHPGQHNAFYCGTGWRASLAFFYAWVMGWENISVYDGGWHEWSSDPTNPIERRSDMKGLVAA